MPIPELAKLDKNSSPEQQKAAISACIAVEVGNGKSQDQAAAMCYSMVRQATGSTLTEPGETTPVAQQSNNNLQGA